jgi:hypothetical protein
MGQCLCRAVSENETGRQEGQVDDRHRVIKSIGDVNRVLIPAEREEQLGLYQALEGKGFGIAPREEIPAGNGRDPLEGDERRGGIPARQE